MKKAIAKTVEVSKLPSAAETNRAELAALAAKADDDIDYSDIPAADVQAWAGAVRGAFYRPMKSSTTVRIDTDVLAWLKGQGRGYQTRINAILRREMLAALKR